MTDTPPRLIPLDIPECPDTCPCRRIGAAVPADHPWATPPAPTPDEDA